MDTISTLSFGCMPGLLGFAPTNPDSTWVSLLDMVGESLQSSYIYKVSNPDIA